MHLHPLLLPPFQQPTSSLLAARGRHFAFFSDGVTSHGQFYCSLICQKLHGVFSDMCGSAALLACNSARKCFFLAHSNLFARELALFYARIIIRRAINNSVHKLSTTSPSNTIATYKVVTSYTEYICSPFEIPDISQLLFGKSMHSVAD